MPGRGNVRPKLAAEPAKRWRAGVAQNIITPTEPIWLSGYEKRNHTGVLRDLHVKALALQNGTGRTAVFVIAGALGCLAAKLYHDIAHLLSEPRIADWGAVEGLFLRVAGLFGSIRFGLLWNGLYRHTR